MIEYRQMGCGGLDKSRSSYNDFEVLDRVDLLSKARG
jgi:hypothetical protein